jgi:hypothetical protein
MPKATVGSQEKFGSGGTIPGIVVSNERKILSGLGTHTGAAGSIQETWRQ